MMTIRVDVVSAQAKIFSGKAELVIVPAALGEMGIAPRHAPLLTKLKPGTVRILENTSDASGETQEEVFYVQGGLVEVQPHLVTILADVVMRADNLDEAAALAVKKQATAALSAPKSDINYSQAIAELAQAVAQIHTIKQLRKNLKVKNNYD